MLATLVRKKVNLLYIVVLARKLGNVASFHAVIHGHSGSSKHGRRFGPIHKQLPQHAPVQVPKRSSTCCLINRGIG
jgi:hypothetical protein